jgi:hypothetical protein
MDDKISSDKVYMPSEEIVAREIQGEFVIIPITSGVGDSEDEIFTLNETGKAVWDRLDGKKSLKEISGELGSEFEGTTEEIEKDCLGLVKELLQRRIIIESKNS